MKNYQRINIRSNRTINPNWTGGKIIGPFGAVVHHDAQIRPAGYSSLARYEAHARLHNQWGYGNIGMQYHIRIDNAGQVFLSREFEKILYHAGKWNINQRNIAICLDGFFHAPHNQQPTREQYEALTQTLDWLRGVFKFPRADVSAHMAHSATACPGDVLLPFVKQYRRNTNKIPSGAKYAFPEWQPQPAPKPTPAPEPKPIPVPPAPKPKDPVYKQNVDTENLPAFYVADGSISLYEIGTKKVVTDFENGHDFTFVARTTDAYGQKWLLTEYSVDRGLWNGVKEDEVRLKTIEDKPEDHEHDLGDIPERLSALEAIVGRIVEFLKSIFKGFGG